MGGSIDLEPRRSLSQFRKRRHSPFEGKAVDQSATSTEGTFDEVVSDSQPSTQPALSSQEINEETSPRKAQSAERRSWLQPLDDALVRIDLCQSSIVIGRADDDPAVDYNINSLRSTRLAIWNTLSRRHFSLERKWDGELVLTDLSRNGTFVNRELVGNGKSISIAHRDVISMGHASFYSYMYEELCTERELPPALQEKYLITGSVLGTGGYGKVVLGKVRDSKAKWVAIKSIAKTKWAAKDSSRSAADPGDINNEVACMKDIKHPNCIRIEDVMETPNHAYIVLEYVDGGELYDRIVDERRGGRGLGERLTKFYALQLFDALEYLHSIGVCHRDIKPENILLADREEYTVAKLTDFGLSKQIKAGIEMKTYCGTPSYIAPEILTNENEQYTPAVDVWSLGVVLFTAIVGYPPFAENYPDGLEMNKQIIKGRLIFSHMWKPITAVAQAFIKQLLKVNPKHRTKPSSAVMHAWFDQQTRDHVAAVVKHHMVR
ncbi:hypothetical protein PENTCL1PPCAC_20978, partial [Pristionchus entomophagus]